ncbi:acyl-CoA dehydrogenase family protein [Actinoallomurus rhizosphaericola]|uniref:acyl-CoA dehydrogenase family protein n=1 Tax=Actinoallomurus rhizosphaericola TaxID=2952536 RepID=UPI0020939D7F|nr:acyl-CoA dehydrogenase family protein [Actinoallomurus rhizosphaericola]MCO5997987.1 acyl-CoA dehydrogenase family protein [Actinoallomurus rhizosphaericola]
MPNDHGQHAARDWAGLPEEEFRLTVRAVLAELLDDHVERWERDGSVPREVWTRLGSLGLLGMGLAADWGGAGADLSRSVAWLTELGRTGYGGFRTAIAVHGYMATRYLSECAERELQDKYLRPSVTGAKIAALAISEPYAGSNLAALTTQAVLEGDAYVISGVKKAVVNGTIADYFVLACRTSTASSSARTGMSLLVVDAALPGISVSPQPTLGWRSAGIATVRFDRVAVPASQLIGRPGGGFFQLVYGLQYERLVAAAAALGGVEFCLELLAHRLRTWRVQDRRLADFQAVRHRYAVLATEAAAARELVARASRGFDSSQLPVAECSMAKAFTTELASRAADAFLQLHGSDGYDEDSVGARLLRDSRAATIAAGPTEVMYDLIAGALLD